MRAASPRKTLRAWSNRTELREHFWLEAENFVHRPRGRGPDGPHRASIARVGRGPNLSVGDRAAPNHGGWIHGATLQPGRSAGTARARRPATSRIRAGPTQAADR